jgi:hypothetical protein
MRYIACESSASTWYVGANIPGKPRVFMPYIGGITAYKKSATRSRPKAMQAFVRVHPSMRGGLLPTNLQITRYSAPLFELTRFQSACPPPSSARDLRDCRPVRRNGLSPEIAV